MVVDVDDFDLHFFANLAEIFDAADETARQFTDVAQAIASGKDFNEGPEVLDAGHFAIVDLADLDAGRAGFDCSQSFLSRSTIGAGDGHGTIFCDFDYGAGRLLDATNVFATRANQHTDLFRIDFGA